MDNELERLREREHLLSAIIAGMERFEEVVAVIRASESADDARAALMALLGIDEYQARAVANIQVVRLAGNTSRALAEEHAQVLADIAGMS